MTLCVFFFSSPHLFLAGLPPTNFLLDPVFCLPLKSKHVNRLVRPPSNTCLKISFVYMLEANKTERATGALLDERLHLCGFET